jgi:hypothetical protein
MKKLIFGGFLGLIIQTAFSQNKFTISGYVRDSLSAESLIGASVTVNGNGANSNQYGFYSITLPEGSYAVSCSYVGYQPLQEKIGLFGNMQLNFLLTPKKSTNEEVIVYYKRRDANVKNAQMGKIDLTMNQVKSLPVLFWEVNIKKTLQLLP